MRNQAQDEYVDIVSRQILLLEATPRQGHVLVLIYWFFTAKDFVDFY